MGKSDRTKIRVQKFIVGVSVFLMAGKFVAFLITNSVGIFTDAMESIVNVIAGFVGLYSLYVAAKPKDVNHPYGHGKAEFISASIEGILITLAGGIIIFEGIRRLYEPGEIGKLDTGIIIVAAAGLVNYIAGWYSIRAGRKHNSMALIAGGKHLHSDTYSSIGLVVGLILLYITGISWIDSALALIFGGVIIYTGVGILRKTVSSLMDSSDDKALEMVLKSIVRNRQPEWIDIHNTRIVKYGSVYHIDCDITLPFYYTIQQGHDSYDKLKKIISEEIPNGVFFTVHIDPCKEQQCRHCLLTECPQRKHPFESETEMTIAHLIQSDE